MITQILNPVMMEMKNTFVLICGVLAHMHGGAWAGYTAPSQCAFYLWHLESGFCVGTDGRDPSYGITMNL
jgi:hypothetical protein